MLAIAILGSVRTMRDFIEGPSLLYPEIQDSIEHATIDGGGVSLSRLWLDNATTTKLSFTPTSSSAKISRDAEKFVFDAGTYLFNASFNYPQLHPLSVSDTLNGRSQGLISQQVDQTESLAFLSYSDKLLAGAWRFLTYFGRDSMLFMLLANKIMSAGKDSSLEAGITAVLQRINRTDGSGCHEETVGDYATWLNLQTNTTSTKSQCSYIMVDTDFFVPIMLANYFLDNEHGMMRASDLLATETADDFGNGGLMYGGLALVNAERIVNSIAPFASQGGQVRDNLIHLKDGEIVGEWRDSTYGIGGGRIPYDINTALAPASLRAIARLAGAGFFPSHPDWEDVASRQAQVFEDETLRFYQVSIPQAEARQLV